jgi:hypothetical protein
LNWKYQVPAIYPARLRNQTANLSELYDQPARFTLALTDLLDLYSNRTHRAGQAGEPPPLLKTYNVPKPVIRQLMVELQPLANEYPDETIRLVYALWAEESLETRQIAAFLLGSIPPNRPEMILEIVTSWLTPIPEDRLISVVLQLTLVRVREENPAALLTQIESWLESEQITEQQIGLKSLKSILNSRDSQDFPLFMRLVSPFTRKAPLQIRSDILDVLEALAIRSPKETAYLLRQSLNTPNNPDTALLIRKLLPVFPPDLEVSLKQALRDARE